MEQFSFWVQAIISVLTGLAVVVPLIVELVKYIQKAVKERNWSAMLSLVMKFMAEAEKMFEDGADKKAWVMSQLEAAADTLNYEINWEQVSAMIDAMCDMAREVNVIVVENEPAAE